MFLSAARSSAFSLGRSAFVASGAKTAVAKRAVSTTSTMYADAGQAEVILVGCGAPNRGMGWYHAVQMLDDK